VIAIWTGGWACRFCVHSLQCRSPSEAARQEAVNAIESRIASPKCEPNTTKFALYFFVDDENRHTDAASFLAHITDLSLIAMAVEILPIVGHHLVERATDVVLDKSVAAAVALKNRLASVLRLEKAGRRSEATPSAELATESATSIGLMTNALEQSDDAEMTSALAAGEAAVADLVRTELSLSGAKARDYSIAITREIKIAVTKK